MPIKRDTAKIHYATEDGVCIEEMKSGAYMVSVARYETGVELLNLIPQSSLLSFHQDFMLDRYETHFQHTNQLINLQAVYSSKERKTVSGDIVIKPLDESYLGVLLDHYDYDVGADYLRQSLHDGEIFGGYFGSSLIGFVGVHAEGSLGILKVLGKYQKRGFGSMLTDHVINHQLDKGIVPFAQIGTDNAASLSMVRKVGFTLSTERVYWLF